MKLSLEKLQELLPDGRLDRRKKNLSGKCPYCGEQSFGISLEDNHLFGCYRKKHCGQTGNIFKLAKFLNRTDLLNIEGEVGKQQEAKLENKLIKSYTSLDLTLQTIKMPLGFQPVEHHPYLESRGFTQYDRYKPGTTKIHPKLKNNYIIFPITVEGEVKGFISRHIWSKEKLKEENERRKKSEIPEILRYINSDTDFAKILFGSDTIINDITKTIICVEGLFDLFNVCEKLDIHSQEKVGCVATFKCAISPEQIFILQSKGVETLVLFYDNDVVTQIKKTAGELQLYFNVLIAFNSYSDADAGDIDETTLTKVFNNLQSPTEFFISQI